MAALATKQSQFCITRRAQCIFWHSNAIEGGGGGGGVKLLGERKPIRASAFWKLLARMASALKIKCPTLEVKRNSRFLSMGHPSLPSCSCKVRETMVAVFAGKKIKT